jgi:hypothetical protein
LGVDSELAKTKKKQENKMKKKWKLCLLIMALCISLFLQTACVGMTFQLSDEVDELELGDRAERETEFQSTASELIVESAGNDTTGQFTAWFAGLGSLPVAIVWMNRQVSRRIPMSEKLKSGLGQLSFLVRKYLMPWHTYLSIIALIIGILHLALSSCVGNPFPEAGLILMGVLGATGLAFKLKFLPATWKAWLYKFHGFCWSFCWWATLSWIDDRRIQDGTSTYKLKTRL